MACLLPPLPLSTSLVIPLLQTPKGAEKKISSPFCEKKLGFPISFLTWSRKHRFLFFSMVVLGLAVVPNGGKQRVGHS